MRKNSQFAIGACVIVFMTAAANYGFGKLPVPTPHVLPIAQFPATIGEWQSIDTKPIDPDVQARLPSAHITDHDYTNNVGETVDLTMVTATDSLDIHDPSVCFPAQGWTIVKRSQIVVDNVPMTAMLVRQDSQYADVLYWFTGYYEPRLASNGAIQAAADVRKHVIGKKEGESLLVRVVAPESPTSAQSATDFAKAIIPTLHSVVVSQAAPTETPAPV